MKKSISVKIIASAALAVIAFLAELYVMVNQSDDLVYLFLFGLLFIVFVTCFALSLIQEHNERTKQHEEQYDNIFKSEKASYLTIRNNFDKINDRLDEIEKQSKVPADEIIKAQKAIAKINIARSKENADAILNSNDNIINKLADIEQHMFGSTVQIQASEQASKELSAKTQEVLSQLKNAELSIRNEILSVRASGYQPVQQMYAPQPEMVESAYQPEAEETIAEPETPVEEVAPEQEAPETPVEEAVLEQEMPIIQPVSDDPNHVMTPDEIAAMLETTEQTAATESEPVIEETIAEPETPVEEVAPEQEAPETPVEEAEPEQEMPTIQPVSDDPNHVMTPDEIAALLEATTQVTTPEAEPEAAAIEEPEPAVEEPEAEPETAVEEAVEPEKPAMPDLSADPNHIMTPEEIAALLANV